MKFICLDGKIITADKPVLMADNRSFRYGDGLFETMKMIDGRVVLKDFHFERLFTSLALLQYKVPISFTPAILEKLIRETAGKNGCDELARVRLTVFRGNGNLYPSPESLHYIIECSSLDASVNSLNEEGLLIGIYYGMQKSGDIFSTIKSANFLPYVMATLHKEENKWDDCILLNTQGNIADTTIATIFLVQGNIISTPALTEGCINGVMRRYVLQKMKENGYTCAESQIKEVDLQKADEIFLTNAINGIRWVKKIRDKEYCTSFTAKLYKEFIQTIFS